MNKFALLIALLSLHLFNNEVKAIIANPESQFYTLPNGRSITIKLHGDEHYSWLTTIDGYRITKNEAGYFVYVSQLKLNKIIPSNIVASNPSERSYAEQGYLKTLEKNVGVEEQIKLKKTSKLKSGLLKSTGIAFPSTGIRKNLLILANFSDKATTYTQSSFNNLMNEPNYKGIGSFRDYYLENSGNLLDITTTITIWVTVPNTYLYYSNEANWAQFAYDAIKAADPIVDYSQFEKSGNQIAGVTIIHQGRGQESSGNTNDMWSHQGEISSYKPSSTLRTFDGVVLDSYSLQPEIFNNLNYMSSLGVIVHEFGHLLGLPDFYDTDYAVSGQYEGTGQWDLMAAGAYNGSYSTSNPNQQEGACPAHHNILSKTYLKWTTLEKINTQQSISLNPVQLAHKGYKIETSTPKEYFYLENREKTGFDAQLPGEGMLIYHVDSTWIEQHTVANDINNGVHQGLYLKVASGGTTNSLGCPFPGIDNITNITDETLPNLKSWALNNTNKSITTIKRGLNGVITFDFMFLQNGSPLTFEAKPYKATTNELSWTLSTLNKPVIVAFSTSETFGAPVNSNTYIDGDILPGGGTVLYVGSNTTFSHTSLTTGTVYYYKIWSNNNQIYSGSLSANAKTVATTTVFPWIDSIGTNLTNWHQEWVSGSNTVWTARNGGLQGKPSPVTPEPGADTTIFTITQQFTGASKSRLISPTFETAINQPYRLAFKHAQPAYKGDQDTLRILIKPILSGEWTQLAIFKTDIPNWKYQEFDLPNTSDPFQIAFESSCYNGYGISIDSVSLVQIAPLVPINHKIIAKNGSQLISGAAITLLEQSVTTNAQGEALFTSQKPSRNWELLKVKANGYEENYTKVAPYIAITDTIQLIKAEAISPTNFSATNNYQTVSLNWNSIFDESFEGYAAWDTTKIGSWLLNDFDEGVSGGYLLFDYPYNISQSAFVVFDGSYGGNTKFFEPHSGKQMAAAFYSRTPPNNDWMISPQTTIVAGDYLELYAKTADDEYGLETMRILISETNTDTASFKAQDIKHIDVPAVWTKYEYDLTKYVGKKVFLAVNCVSYDKYALLVDDIKIRNSATNAPQTAIATTHISTPQESGNIEYQIVRDGAVIATINGFNENNYIDQLNDCQPHTYSVQTNYLSPTQKSAPSNDQNIVSCRIIKIIVTENTVPVLGISVKIDDKTVLTNNLGEALFEGVSDNTHTLNITQLGYTTISETINITKDSTISKEIVPVALVANNTFDNIRLAPYPCNGNFTLTNKDLPVPFYYSIVSITGEQVQSGEITKIGDTQITINSSTSGTYLLKMTLNGMVETKKIVVVR